LIELNGIELSGIELSGIELNGIELSGIELSGTPPRASDRRVTPVDVSVDPIPKAAQLDPTDGWDSSAHHAVRAAPPALVPPRPIELNGVAPSSIELRGMELSGLAERSRAPRSTEFKFAEAVEFRITSASVTDSRGTPS
jgi:hypothetical protein